MVESTLTELLKDITRREKNSLEIIKGFQEIFTTDKDEVVISYMLEDGSLAEYKLPSNKKLKNDIDKLKNDVSFATSKDSLSDSFVDYNGTTKKLKYYDINIPPSVPVPFFDSLFYMKDDGSYNVDIEITKDININRSLVNIIELDRTPENVALVNSELLDNSYDYDKLKSIFSENDVEYSVSENILNTSVRLPAFYGEVIVSDISVDNNDLIYYLDKITYKSYINNSDIEYKEDDVLYLSDDPNTSFKITNVDRTKLSVRLMRISGSSIVTKGSILKIYPTFIKGKSVTIKVSPSKIKIVFFKLMNDYGVISEKWSNGVLIEPGIITNSDGISLLKYSDDDVQPENIPLYKAVKPNVVVLNTNNFSVVKINDHKDDLKGNSSLKQKISEKANIAKKIEKLNGDISSLKTKLYTFNYKNEQEYKNDEILLENIVNKRDSMIKQYNTLVEEIASSLKDINQNKPKYRVRGFFDIPDPVYLDPDNKIGKQEIIQFIIEYRYLSKDGTAANPQEIKYLSKDGTEKKGVFSRWKRILSKIREKDVEQKDEVVNTETGILVVKKKNIITKEENVLDPEQINVNQIDIPISYGESVEIRVKSISEVSYPNVTSDWSDSVIIEFPEELKDDVIKYDDVAQEQTKSRFMEELSSQGVFDHISDMAEVGDDLFKHLATNIATTFKTPENKPIDVNQKLVDLNNIVEELRAIINKESGKLSVNILDENGNVIQQVSRNSSINIFSGYYKDEVSGNTVQKGSIISKIYYIEIGNVSDALLELISFVPGLSTEKLPVDDPNDPNFIQNYEGYLYNKNEYSLYRKYWRVPMSLRAITDDATYKQLHDPNNYPEPYVELPPFQSSQVKGQFIYARHTDISLGKKLYDGISLSPSNQVYLPIMSGSTQSTFVWDGSQSILSVNGNGYLSDFCVHVDHPDLQPGSDFMTNYSSLWNPLTKLPYNTVESNGDVNMPLFIHSLYFNLQDTDNDGLKQLDYVPYTVNNSNNANINNFPKKMSFSKNDKYLIGKNTCGSYLFMAPSIPKDITTNSVIYNEGLIVKKGDSNKIRIPVIFQYRMTDYYGSGQTGTGILGGYGSPNISNLTYSKKMGFDIVILDQKIFSFDLKFTAKYKQNSAGDTDFSLASNNISI